MASYKESELYNNSGDFDPTAAAVLGRDHDDIEIYIRNCVIGPFQSVRFSPIGELKYRNRKQYIRDKLCMIRDEFHVMPTEKDISHICRKLYTRFSIDLYCRQIINRAYHKF